MEEIALILFVLGLMVLFFLLGAAIGGVARSLKAYFFGVKDHEKVCGERKSSSKDVQDQSFDEAAAALAAGAVASGVALTDTGDKTTVSEDTVQVTHDELEADDSKEWAEESTETAEKIDETVEVSRATEEEVSETDDNEDLSVAAPLEGEQQLEEDLSEIEVTRDESQEINEAQEIVESHESAEQEKNTEQVSSEPEHAELATEETPIVEEPQEETVAEVHQEIAEQVETSIEEASEDTSSIVEASVEQTSEETDVDLSDIAGAAAAAVAGVAAVTVKEDEEEKAEEQTGAPVWDYTEQTADYSDVVFTADGVGDNLQLIKGIDAEMEAQLKEIGLRQFDQITALTEREVNFLRDKFNFYSTLNEQVWIEQAKILSTGQLTAYAQSLAQPSETDVQAAVVEEASIEQTSLEEASIEETSLEEIVNEEEIPQEDVIEETVSEETSVEEDSVTLQEEIVQEDVTEVIGQESEAESSSSENVEIESSEQENSETETQDNSSLAGLAAAGLAGAAVKEASDAFAENDAGRAEREPREDREPRGEREPREDREPRSEREPRENRRLFGEKERAERDEEWRNRYQGERKIKSPEHSQTGTIEENVEQNEETSELVAQHEEETTEQITETPIEETTTAEITEVEVSEAEIASTGEGVTEAVGDEAQVEEVPLQEEITLEETVSTELQEQGFVRPVDSDDLSQIRFISTGLEKKLNLLGVYKLSQIAGWSDEKIAEISEQLELRREKIIEEDWRGLAQEALDKQQEESTNEAAAGGVFSASALVARLAELDKISDLNEHEKTLLSNNGITELSQIANWSGADVKWASDLLDLSSTERAESWVTTASALISSGDINIPGGEASGDADDLKRIRGIDDEAADSLKSMGVTTYAQIAEWQQADMDRVNDLLGTSGRVERQYWVVQAKVLKDGGHTDFSKLYDES